MSEHLCTLHSRDNDITTNSALQFVADENCEIRACFIQWREIDYQINNYWQNHDCSKTRDVVLFEDYERD